jgi:hypothetical protein
MGRNMLRRRSKKALKAMEGQQETATRQERSIPEKETQAPRLGRRFERFTQRARRALLLAQEEARRLNHDFIGTEHLLLALVAEGEGVGPALLAGAGVELSRVRAEVERVVGRGTEPPAGEMSLTPRCKRVLALAVNEARQLNHAHVGTEHLLLALLREEEGVAARVLMGLGVQLEKLRDRTREMSPMAPIEEFLGPLRMGTTGATRDSVITIRVSDADLAAVDSLVEVGIMKTRSEAAAWLLHSGIAASRPLFERAQDIISEIRRLREEAQRLAEEHAPRAD